MIKHLKPLPSKNSKTKWNDRQHQNGLHPTRSRANKKFEESREVTHTSNDCGSRVNSHHFEHAGDITSGSKTPLLTTFQGGSTGTFRHEGLRKIGSICGYIEMMSNASSADELGNDIDVNYQNVRARLS
jgi:hypothetical protein